MVIAQSKQSCARIAVWRDLNILMSYTLEVVSFESLQVQPHFICVPMQLSRGHRAHSRAGFSENQITLSTSTVRTSRFVGMHEEAVAGRWYLGKQWQVVHVEGNLPCCVDIHTYMELDL